jgi:hypothetical protein
MRIAAAVLAAAFGTVVSLVGASPAEAAVSASSTTCNYANEKTCGNGTFTWASNTYLSNGVMNVVRWCGTGSGGAVIQIQVFESQHGLQYGPEHSNTLRCGNYERFPSSGSTSWTSTGGNICWWRVATADTPAFSQILYGTIQYNPNHPAGC